LHNHNIQEQIRQIMLSEELSDTEKLDRLHALIPLDAFKIDNLNQATPAQLKQLKDGLAIAEAMQQVRRAELLLPCLPKSALVRTKTSRLPKP
jgi:hypothetical protein